MNQFYYILNYFINFIYLFTFQLINFKDFVLILIFFHLFHLFEFIIQQFFFNLLNFLMIFRLIIFLIN